MTTRELIDELQKLDPSGELRVVYMDYEYGTQEPNPRVKDAPFVLYDSAEPKIKKGQSYIEL